MQLLYFIPGTMCNELLWSKLWPLLGKSCQLIHLTIPKEGNLVEVIAELVLQIKTSSHGQKFGLIGFSLGGYLASAVSLEFDSQLEKLMVIANTPKALPDKELIQRERIISTVKSHGYHGINRSRVTSFIDEKQHHNNELIELIQQMDSSFGAQELSHHIVALSKRKDLCLELQQSKKKIWFCHGDSDHLVDSPRMQIMQLESACIKLKKVPQCGHFLPLEQPIQLSILIRDWLQDAS
ncbi:MAG: 2-succinyl-6-hydroxy-2,4-cyclohexadiene-1-carboxylate synthase [Oceanospirillaceae bacterium]|jgi:2-succinyl-6-hydroxy-2,4-cyclohexadiene-1-carboxylate synthase